jgi:hypothetical protein
MPYLLLLFAVNLYFAWRYADMDIDPDFAMFNLWGQTGAAYGRDFSDCKTPMVHLWFLLLSKITKTIQQVRFVHYFLTGIPGMIYALITGDTWGGLAFIVLVHSGFLLAFHGNVGDIPAGLILLALVAQNPWIAVTLFVFAFLYEPKLLPSFLFYVALRGLWWQSVAWLAVGLVCAGLIWYFKHDWWRWLVEANITIPARMNKRRKGVYGWMPWFTAGGVLYLGMWLFPAVINKPDIVYWMMPICYMIFISMGLVIRPNHLLPLIPWIALSEIDPKALIGLCVIDFVAGGFYLGDLWGRFYVGIRDTIKESRRVGEWLKDKPGTLWVNSIWTETYIWAGKAPTMGVTNQAEIIEVNTERKKTLMNRFAENPPDWIAHQGAMARGIGMPEGYRLARIIGGTAVYKKEER